MGRKKQVIPVVENSEVDDSDIEGGGEGESEGSDEDSGRGLLSISVPVIKDGGSDVGGDDDDNPKKLNKPMMSTLADVVDEGLGDDFEDTQWVPPTVKRAEDSRAQTIYRAGKSSIWDTRLHELEDMGVGVSLYFQFLKFLAGTYFVLTVLSVPSLAFSTSGEGFTEVNIFTKLLLTFVGNVGYPCDDDEALDIYASGCNATAQTAQDVYGHAYTLLDISYYITFFEVISSIFFILAIVFWRWRTNYAAEKVDASKITAVDYAVYVEGLPKSAERKDIGQFFSDLYQLENPDWKGRAPYTNAQPVFSVENTEDKWYLGKWVAEVCVAREVGRELKAYKDKKDTVLDLRRKRAEAKMYNDGTPLLEGNGADPSKFEKAIKAADKLGEAIARTTDRMMEMRKDIHGKQPCVGCYIVFNHPLSLHRCMDDFASLSWWKRYPMELKFQGQHKLKVMKAPEPDNIIWENLEFSKRKRKLRQNATGWVSFVLLVLSFILVLGISGVQDTMAQIVPKIAYCQYEVPALYLNNYSRALAVIEDLALVRPDQSYREDQDAECADALDDKSAAYVVYTIESGEDSWKNPILNYTLTACESDGDEICPEMGDELHCPCASSGSSTKCTTLECEDPTADPGGSCGEFVFSTVSGCYCYDRLFGGQATGNIISAGKDLRANDTDLCGSFLLFWILAKILNFIISFVTPTINSWLESALTGLVAWQHNTSDDETATRLMFGVFQSQFINTGLLFLLVYGKAPQGYTTPQILQDFKILSGSYDDFSRAWQADAGFSLLTSYILAAIVPHFWPLWECFFLSKRRIKKATKAVEEGDGTFTMQSDLNDVFVGPVFDFTTRYSYLLTLLFVAMAYSGGMFCMNLLSFLFFLITYWVDKAMLLRFYRRPPHREDALQRQVNNTLPWALFLHLCFACWFMGTESLQSEVITESMSSAASYKDFLTEYEDEYGILVTRLIRTNVFPIFLLTVGVFVWCVLEFIGDYIPVFALMGAGFSFVGRAFCGRSKIRAVLAPGKPMRSKWTSEVAAYTDVYFQYIPRNGDLTTAEKLEGWMVSHLADGAVVKKKGWNMDDEEEPPVGRDAKFSWEVIRDNSVFTYRIDLVPGYSEIMAALQEEERLYKEDMAAETDDSDESSQEASDDDGNSVEEQSESQAPESATRQNKPNKGPTYNPFMDMDAGDLGGSTEGENEDYNPFADFMDGMDDDD